MLLVAWRFILGHRLRAANSCSNAGPRAWHIAWGRVAGLDPPFDVCRTRSLTWLYRVSWTGSMSFWFLALFCHSDIFGDFVCAENFSFIAEFFRLWKSTFGYDASVCRWAIFNLADNPGSFTCWSGSSGRLPCPRTNGGKLWSPFRKRFLISVVSRWHSGFLWPGLSFLIAFLFRACQWGISNGIWFAGASNPNIAFWCADLQNAIAFELWSCGRCVCIAENQTATPCPGYSKENYSAD